MPDLKVEIEELVKWELTTMDYDGLKEFFFNNMSDFYRQDSKAFNDMKIYMNQCKELWGG